VEISRVKVVVNPNYGNVTMEAGNATHLGEIKIMLIQKINHYTVSKFYTAKASTSHPFERYT